VVRAVIQRVTRARVAWRQGLIDHAHEIGPGVVVLLAVAGTDSDSDAHRMADRIVTLRIFNGAQSKSAHSLLDAAGEAMVVPQFTLYADSSRGRRPSFLGAAPPGHAQPLFELFCRRLESRVAVKRGGFGAHMELSLVNDGPFTLILDSADKAGPDG